MIYTDKNLQPIQEGQTYDSPNGTRYPHNFPRNEIPGLVIVVETPRPDDPNLVVTGFTINNKHEQVWQTRVKTQSEIDAEKPVITQQEIILKALEMKNALTDEEKEAAKAVLEQERTEK